MGDDDNTETYTIEELARSAGMTPRNVRAYRTKGLLPPPGRLGRSSRYGPGHLARLRQIRHLREAGLPLKLIVETVANGADLGPEGPLGRIGGAAGAPAGRRGGAAGIGLIDLTAGAGAPAGNHPERATAASLVDRLVAHGVTRRAAERALAQCSATARESVREVVALICRDQAVGGPDQLPPPMLATAARLVVLLTQEELNRAMPAMRG